MIAALPMANGNGSEQPTLLLNVLTATKVSGGCVAGLETEWCDAISNVEEGKTGQKKLSQDPTGLR
jgi:hypothetical protein